jgi:hypothetical protein
MKMLRHTEIDGTNITLQVEHAGYPWWLIASRGAGKDGECWSKIFDNQPEAEKVYDVLALRFAHDYLKRVINDDDRFARMMRLLADLESDPFFCRAIKAGNQGRLIESLLSGILEESEEVETVA